MLASLLGGLSVAEKEANSDMDLLIGGFSNVSINKSVKETIGRQLVDDLLKKYGCWENLLKQSSYTVKVNITSKGVSDIPQACKGLTINELDFSSACFKSGVKRKKGEEVTRTYYYVTPKNSKGQSVLLKKDNIYYSFNYTTGEITPIRERSDVEQINNALTAAQINQQNTISCAIPMELERSAKRGPGTFSRAVEDVIRQRREGDGDGMVSFGRRKSSKSKMGLKQIDKLIKMLKKM